jgi:uncharacterized membrane protein
MESYLITKGVNMNTVTPHTHTRHKIAFFDEESDARAALQDLMDAAFPSEDISVVTRNHDENEGLVHSDDASDVVESAVNGAGAGAAAGGMGALLAGLAALAIPGVGPLLGAGPIALSLLGITLGAGAGATAGTLSRLAFNDDDIEKRLEDGTTIIGVTGDELRLKEAQEIFEKHNPQGLNDLLLDRVGQKPDFTLEPAPAAERPQEPRHETIRASEASERGVSRSPRHRRLTHRERDQHIQQSQSIV